ncbi:MAG: glycosyltransferase family 2 protein [Planctomycetaceae bacterium]
MRITVITAFLNEASNLPLFRERVLAVLRNLDCEYEIILVDDHSSDESSSIAKNWVRDDPCVHYLRLSRSCGSHAAFSAGLARATGDCTILLAADLQDPPETIPRLLDQWQSGYDVVWAAREAREGESWRTQFTARLYYQMMRRFALPDMPKQGADFLLMDRKVVAAYNAIPEKNTSFLALILWIGFRQTTIEYVKQARHSGKSKWNLSKKIKLFVDSMVSFSYAPIRMMSVIGLMISLAGFAYAAFIIFNAIFGQPAEGWSSLIVIVLVLGGFQLLMLGVLGEYLWRAFDESRGRPRYIIEEIAGVPPDSVLTPRIVRDESVLTSTAEEDSPAPQS